MKKINPIKICFTLAGSILGAGYVSGQELYSFFGSFGVKGIYAIVAAVILQTLFGVFIFKIAMDKNTEALDKIIVPNNNVIAEKITVFFQILFLFCVAVVMMAGAGATANQIFGVPSSVGCIVFGVIVCGIAMAGVGGMVTVFSLFVPALVVMCVTVSVLLISKNGVIPDFNNIMIRNRNNPLMGSVCFSAITYVSYNVFSAVGILSPVGREAKKTSTVVAGSVFGGILLLIIAMGILFAMNIYPESVKEELPMLYACTKYNKIFGYVYSVLLFGGMLGACISCLVAIITFVESKKPKLKKKRPIFVLSVGIVMIFASLAGFSNLIGIVYPIFGYIGFFFLAMIVINFFLCKKQRNKQEK